nr:13990_t:CDS:2 [Entrophospora candida]
MLNLPPLINEEEKEEEEITVIRNVPRKLSSVDEVFENSEPEPSGESLLNINREESEINLIFSQEDNEILFVGEVTSSAEKGNVFKNCNDSTRVGIFMKDCIDSAVDKGADIKVLVKFKIDFYIMELSSKELYFMYNVGQVLIPASVKEISRFINDLETLLMVCEIFEKSFVDFFDKLCNPKQGTEKASFKCETLSTPSFNMLVNHSRNVNRKCPFWFGRF